MITTPEEYYAHLHRIQSENPPTLAILQAGEKIYNIDLNTRTLESPEFLGVVKDHASETIYFAVDRYYDYRDLANTICIIQYITSDGEARIYAVPFYDVITLNKDNTADIRSHKMLVPWNVGAGATRVEGPVQYSLRFYLLDDTGKKFAYNLNTLTATSQVLYGMEAQEISGEYEFSASQYDKIMQEIEKLSRQLDIYWDELYA